MTNREKFEQEKTNFGKVMEKFNESGMADFNEFLNAYVANFDPGDIIILNAIPNVLDKWGHQVVFRVLKVFDNDSMYLLEYMTPITWDGVDVNPGEQVNLSVAEIDLTFHRY